MAEIPLTQGYVAIVDDEDYELVSKYRWHARKTKYTVYAVRWKNILMHRIILGLDYKDPRQGIHLDDNGLNNRRNNLIAGDNALNQALRRRRTTHCPQGHAYVGDNAVVNSAGYTYCRICHNRHKSNWRKAHAQK